MDNFIKFFAKKSLLLLIMILTSSIVLIFVLTKFLDSAAVEGFPLYLQH